MAQTPDPAATARRGAHRSATDSLRVVAAAAARVHQWATGAEGRRRTDQVLCTLDRAAWQVAGRIPLPGGGHVDHLVVGPGGVFLLDSRAWHGVVTVDQKGATITPGDDPGAAWTARGEHRFLPPAAAAVTRALTEATGSHLPAPRAVVVVWAPFPERVAVSCGVTYVAGELLADWLAGQPACPDRRSFTAISLRTVTGAVPASQRPANGAYAKV